MSSNSSCSGFRRCGASSAVAGICIGQYDLVLGEKFVAASSRGLEQTYAGSSGFSVPWRT